MKERCISLLNERGVHLNDIAECVLFLQKKYSEHLTIADALIVIDSVLRKNEVQYTIMTGIELDKLTEQKCLNDKVLEKMLSEDASLYGLDEVLAYSICNLFGSIALTNFGYLDKVKHGIVGVLNDSEDHVNTYLDDIVAAIAASAASLVAHRK